MDLTFIAHAHVQPSTKLGCVIITDSSYPTRVAHTVLRKCIEETATFIGKDLAKYEKDVYLNIPAIKGFISEYQKPEEVDKIAKIQKDLAETKEIMLKNIEDLLRNKAELEELANKSQDLSAQSKIFLKQAKKLNSCCIIL